jgi:hypothetical protein
VSLPAAASQCIEAAVIAHARKRIGLDNAPFVPRRIRQHRPRKAGLRVTARNVVGIGTALELGARVDVVGKECRGRTPEEVLVQAHTRILPYPDQVIEAV